MIFITVGTHEQQFNRLVEYIDKCKANHAIKDDIIIQTGYSTYEPQYCQWSKFYSYKEMLNFVKEADIIITHGGPSSFIMPLQIGKIPIVVPRKVEFAEHVNNHQVDFCNAVSKRQGNIIVVEDINSLEDTICQYDKLVSMMPAGLKSNNIKFCSQLEKIVEKLFE